MLCIVIIMSGFKTNIKDVVLRRDLLAMILCTLHKLPSKDSCANDLQETKYK